MIHILIPTDFSDNAWSAIVYALKLYANETCTFYLLHTTNNEMLANRSLVTNYFIEELKRKSFRELLELKTQCEVSKNNENHSFETIISTEKLASAIRNCCEKYKVDLVVMATKGISKNKSVFIGSNTVTVLNKIKYCPILIVPEEFDFVAPKQIAFATDYNRSYKNKELVVLKKLAQLYHSAIKVLHIEEKELSEKQQENIRRLDLYLESQDHSFHWMPKYAKKATVINDFIKELGIDLLVIVNYKHSFIENIINEPVINKIGYYPVIPFLIIPE